jgi:hypothetical protein
MSSSGSAWVVFGSTSQPSGEALRSRLGLEKLKEDKLKELRRERDELSM